jgi:uncharacterized protein
MSGLRIDVADLLAHPGTRRDVRVSATLEGLAGSAARVIEPVEVGVSLERIPDGIVVRGTVTARWQGQCSHCLADLDEPIALHVDELFEADPVEGETYPIEGHEIDLEQLARDAVLLELPLAPHCPTPCVSDADEPDAESASDEGRLDPRWAALSELEIQ